MNSIIYLLQVSACTGVFYLFYYLFLNRLTFFVTNRWYLLVTVVLSFLIPLIKIPVSQPHVYTGVVQQVVYTYTAQENITPTVVQPAAIQPIAPIHWGTVLKLAYLAAVLGLTIHLIVTLAAFFKRLKGKHIAKLGNVRILSGNKKIVNGSFLNYIFLNDTELSPDEMQQIIAHEMLHVKLFHSVDRIIVKLAQIILWFNPFIYLYSRSVEENHEFEVDRAMATGTDKHNYANLLLHLSVAGQGMLYHSFSKVPLKKRISMLFNKPSANMKKIVYVLVLPVVLISCLAFAGLRSTEKDPPYSSVLSKLTKLGKNPLVTIDDKIYPKDILYKIGKACVGGITVYRPDASIVKHGVAIKDGYVEIKTKKGTVTFMTNIEKENLAKEYAVPQAQFYSRLHLKEEDGSLYDKIIMHVSDSGEVSTNVKTGGKVGFVIDSKVFTENEIKHVPINIIKSLSGAYGVGGPESFPETTHLKQFEAVFSFKTKRAEKTELKGSAIPVEKEPKYSAIDGVDRLGDNPVVLINGKEYTKDILYKISPSCIVGMGIWDPDPAFMKHGVYIKDGYIELSTKDGKITYLTEIEKDNLKKLGAIPKTQLYSRVELRDEKGARYQQIMVRIGDRKLTSNVSEDGKVGFIINGQLYNEEQINQLPADLVNSLSGAGGVGPATKQSFPEVDVTGYDMMYRLKVKKPEPTDVKGDNLPTRNDEHKLTFTRTEIRPASTGKGYDMVTLKDAAGSSAQYGVSHDSKIGIFVDKDFYTEEQFKALPADVMATISKAKAVGVVPDLEFGYLKKQGYKTNWAEYAAVFQVFLKTKPPGFDKLKQPKTNKLGAVQVPLNSGAVQSSFFKRTHYQNSDGTSHDKVTFTLSGGLASADLGTTDKIGVFIDHKFYNEAATLKLSPEVTSKLVVDRTHPGFDGYKMPKGNYAIPFKFITKTITAQGVNSVNPRGADVAAPKDSLKIIYTRTAVGSSDMVRVKDAAGSAATTEIEHTAKVGFFIDRDFYTEEQFKKLPEAMMVDLNKSGGMSVLSDPDLDKLKKVGYVTAGAKYGAIFLLYLKTKPTLEDPYKRKKNDTTGAIKNKTMGVNYPVKNHKIGVIDTVHNFMEILDEQQWQAFMGANLPIGKATVADVQIFIERLNKRSYNTHYRLATAREYEKGIFFPLIPAGIVNKDVSTATATDSSYYDKVHRISYLYGKAHVTVGGASITADYIRIDEAKNEIFAKGKTDPKTKRYVGRPESKFSGGNAMISDSLILNYQTQKAKLWAAANPKTR